MSWKVARAKQQLSELIRLSAREPQAIYNREQRVAVLVSAAEYDEFKRWQIAQGAVRLDDQFAEVRVLLAKAGIDAIELPSRSARPNAFLETLNEDDAR
jgi:prevent-host-death family protein